MLGAIVRLLADGVGDLVSLWRLVSANPAAAMGLSDRGRIAPGQRADLLLLDWPDQGVPAPLRTWVAGRGGYSALPDTAVRSEVLG
jgi:alpha-D-ribose 1-methylphosphonate 5-triphosphate diphosphatase